MGRLEKTSVGPRLLAMVLFVAVFFVAGLFFEQPLALLSIPMMCLLGFMLLYLRPPHVAVEVSRVLEKDKVAEGEACRVTLRLRNLRPDGLAALTVRDLVPSELDRKPTQNGFTLELGGSQTRELSYELRPRRFGTYTLGPVVVSAEDASGLLESSGMVESRSTLFVIPESAGKLTRFAIRPRRTRPQPGGIPARRTGSGLDYYSTRPSLAGELPRRVNWRATARAADEYGFMANEYVAELGVDAMIVVEARTASLTERQDHILAHSVRAALSIADRLLRDKNRVGLLAIGSWVERLPPAYGSRQFDRMALAFARLPPGGSFTVASLSSTVSRSHPRVSQVVLVSHLSDEAAFRAAADLARGTTYDTMVVSPNPLDFASKDPRGRFTLREWSLARRLARLERGSRLSRLRAANALVVDWHVSYPLERALDVNRRVLARRAVAPARS